MAKKKLRASRAPRQSEIAERQMIEAVRDMEYTSGAMQTARRLRHLADLVEQGRTLA